MDRYAMTLPGPPLRHYTPPVNGRRWIIPLLVAALTLAVVGGSYAWYTTRDNSQAKALEYARQACAGRSGGPAVDVSTATLEKTASNAAGWQTAADDAARAARLDPAWNELARAMDAEARAWGLADRKDPALDDQLTAVLQEVGEHPVAPECRKATVS